MNTSRRLEVILRDIGAFLRAIAPSDPNELQRLEVLRLEADRLARHLARERQVLLKTGGTLDKLMGGPSA